MRHRLAIGTLLLASSACAFTNPDNTPLVTWSGEALGGPEAPTATKIATAPLAVALGVVDVVIAHPASVVDDAAKDAREWLWEVPVRGAATRSFLFLPRVALTPVLFSASWVARSMFNIPPHGWVAPPPTAEEREERLRALREEAAELRRQLDTVEEQIREATDS
ncbi:MAG: hypothetical protein QF903_02505 [Planctomycetota bacterium]|jgi:hypothetical protein|nr:hypothetical protein [Planctomycetota bacterium]MDP6762795.1 hypothetical protein [Planctomycetota bacterium]MDP6988332.1 hypothetical protein [Planctomycetota bacterium]